MATPRVPFTLPIVASDPDGDALTFSAAGLPAGLTIHATTGIISGTPAAGTFTITVIARDASLLDSETFTLSVDRFTDDALTPGVHSMKVVHITELRTQINTLRTGRGLPAFVWTDPALAAGLIRIKAVHITELRSALNDVYVRLSRTPPVYTDPGLGATATTIKAAHIRELRAALVAAE
jgi:hypothetical protein